MTPLIDCQNISKGYGSRDLFSDISATIFSGDRIGLIGPNGTGKSTFLKLLCGAENPDDGVIITNKGLRVGYVPQNVEEFDGSVEDVVADAAVGVSHLDDHERYSRVRKVLGELGFSDIAINANDLSGGWKRRLTIARVLVAEPDVILLDEPTNHLDIESILWLEGFLRQSSMTFVVTSHDRVFLDTVCSRTWEISTIYPGGLFIVDDAYAEFMERRAGFLKAQKRQESSLRSKLRREEEWLRQTPKARTTKSRSRIQEAAKLQQEFSCIKRRNIDKKAKISVEHSGRLTRKLVTAKNLSKAYGSNRLFSGLDIDILRGDRLGIVGENGSGKSTLMKILAGELDSDSGTVKCANDLDIFFFDQHREKLDLSLSLRRGLAPAGDMIQYRGKNIHVEGWCERFLFTKDRLELPMSELSGGERARVIIARLMIKPADVLFLDEPTNDLDIDTLEILEEGLDDFPGAVIMITHDRAMMDRVADRLIAVDGNAFNDTASWLLWRKELRRQRAKERRQQLPQRKKTKKPSLSYREKRELADMEDKIVTIEKNIATLTKATEDPAIASDGIKLKEACDALAKAQEDLDQAFSRWQKLESMLNDQ